MIRNWTGPLLALALCLGALPAAASFDNVTVSPRARAMGECGAAMADDAFAPYFNPAGLALLAEPTAGASYIRPYGLSFTDFVYLGGALPLRGRAGVVGVGLRRFGVEYGGVDLLRETTLTVAQGLRIYEDMHSTLRAGYALNVYNLKFGPTVGDDGEGANGFDPGSDTAIGLDAGLLVTLHERTRLGVMVKNLNNPQIGLDGEEIGRRLQGGVAYAPYEGVWTTFEFENVLGQDVIYHGGVEVLMDYGFALRMGVLSNPDKLTAGFGYRWRSLGVDYGYSTGGGTLDGSHQFGLTWAWGGEAE
jgi:hypothetical protein